MKTEKIKKTRHKRRKTPKNTSDDHRTTLELIQMLKRHGFGALRCFSANRPPFYDVLPKKSLMNRVLFDLDSRHSYNKLYVAYENIYKRLDSPEEPEIPKYINASDLMIMKKALENIRTISHTANRHLVDLENSLVEKAAEFGNNDAVALLAFEAIVSEDAPQDDKLYAKKLVSGLLELKNPLTIKLSGDLCLKNEMIDQAEKFYNDFLILEQDTFLASEVFKQLGLLNFQKADLVKSKQYFERSVRTGPLDKVAECHYYLGQLNIHDPQRARFHFEQAASQGFKECFQQLGFLELNFFGSVSKAREWFKLGVEFSDVSCIIGLFDVSMKERRYKEAFKSYNTLKTSLENSDDEQNRTVWSHFAESREKAIKTMNNNYQPLAETMDQINKFQAGENVTDITKGDDRWSI